MQPRQNLLSRFRVCRSGHFAVIVGLLAPVLIGVTGGAVDLFRYATHQKSLQGIADGAALAAAREAGLSGWTEAAATAVADAYVQTNVAHLAASTGVVTTEASVVEKERRITVAVEQDHFNYFVMGYFRSSPQIRVSATAQATGSTNVCVIGLNGAQNATISLDSNAVLFAPGCAVYSNSAATKGMKSLSNARLTASLACSTGGFEGASKNFNKVPLTDCPVMADPLIDRPPPPYLTLTCPITGLAKVLDDYVGVLPNGTYCGGLHIKGNSKVTLLPGVYVMKNGPFVVDSNSIVNGKGVGFYFTGAGSNFHFKSNVNVNLEAPENGAMRGLIFYQDRNAPVTNFVIESNYTRNLLGTIYLPKGNLVVKADNDVADQSAYTAIVVNKLQLFSGPRLVLNTDYDDTNVPVPPGLGPTGSKVLLAH